MSKQNDGGPAFPRFHKDKGGWTDGMSIRQYYKAQTMVGLIQGVTMAKMLTAQSGIELDDGLSDADLARAAGTIADSLIAEEAE